MMANMATAPPALGPCAALANALDEYLKLRPEMLRRERQLERAAAYVHTELAGKANESPAETYLRENLGAAAKQLTEALDYPETGLREVVRKVALELSSLAIEKGSQEPSIVNAQSDLRMRCMKSQEIVVTNPETNSIFKAVFPSSACVGSIMRRMRAMPGSYVQLFGIGRRLPSWTPLCSLSCSEQEPFHAKWVPLPHRLLPAWAKTPDWAVPPGGREVRWGNTEFTNADEEIEESLLEDLRQSCVSIASTESAFAALREDGSVVTFGTPNFGGDSSDVAGELRFGVVTVAATLYSFAALRQDGSVLTWGDDGCGGDCSEVAPHLSSGVVSIASTDYAFTALKEDGSTITWGAEQLGGDNTAVEQYLRSGVVFVAGTEGAFAALRSDGTVVTWGDGDRGGDSSGVVDQLSVGRIVSLASTDRAFAALREDGAVITWGDPEMGGDSSEVADRLSSDVIMVCGSEGAFAAHRMDASVVTWGAAADGGDSSHVKDKIGAHVMKVVASGAGFAALRSDGSVVSWGDPSCGGDSQDVEDDLSHDVVSIWGTLKSFVAIKRGCPFP